MRKKLVLLWGNGQVLKQNIVWIHQIYEVVGITGENVKENDLNKGLFTEDEANKLCYDMVMITSMYFEEIKEKLINHYHIAPSKIIHFLDEFRKQRRISPGIKNKNITIYIWRMPYQKRKNGFMNYLEELFVAYHICEVQGYKLVVDMKNYYSEYMRGKGYGSNNVWEEYFQQPSEITLDDAYNSKNVILGEYIDVSAVELEILRNMNIQECRLNNLFLENKLYIKVINFLSEKYGNKFQYSTVLKEKVYDEQIRLFKDKMKILGVIARGSDYLARHPKGHPIPCETKRYIEYVKKIMTQYNYQYLYLATEDLEIYYEFKEQFSATSLLFSEQKRVADCGKHLLMDINFYDKDDGYIRGMEYNLVIAMLAKCDGLLANCMCGAAVGALLQNAGKYSHIEIMDNGIYD